MIERKADYGLPLSVDDVDDVDNESSEKKEERVCAFGDDRRTDADCSENKWFQ